METLKIPKNSPNRHFKGMKFPKVGQPEWCFYSFLKQKVIYAKYRKDIITFLTQTLNFTFLYVTVSTLKPTVGIVLTDCPSLSLYNIVVFPAASRPRRYTFIVYKNKFVVRIFIVSTPAIQNI